MYNAILAKRYGGSLSRDFALVLATCLVLAFIPALLMFGAAPASAFSGSGSGTAGDPYIITNVSQLQEMKDDLTAHYALGNDIDAFATRTWNDNGAGGYYGFEPIGPGATPFTGSFDGRGYKIENLYINRPDTADVGLFGVVGWEGVVENVGLDNENVRGWYDVGGIVGCNYGNVTNSYSAGTVSGGDYVGGLIGINDGTTDNCYFTGSVSGNGILTSGLVGYNVSSGTVVNCHSAGSVSSSSDYVGGLVGYNEGHIDNCYSSSSVSGGSFVGGLFGQSSGDDVENCYSTGSVSGINYVGGLVGFNDYGLTNCYSTGSVSGSGDTVGGLAGYSSGAITNCYSTGSVSGVSTVGGLFGYSASNLINCYSTGSVSGVSTVGGLFALLGGGTVTNSFWDIQTSGQATSAGGTGKTTENMKNVRTFTDNTWSTGLTSPWDFVGNPYYDENNENIWNISSLVNHGYPFLTSFLSIPSAWYQTIWGSSGRTYPELQVGTWNDNYDNYYTGENENNADNELKLAIATEYENGMKMTSAAAALENRMGDVNSKTSIRFTAQESKTVDNVRLFLRKIGAAPTLTCGIQADNGSGYPDGVWLGSGENSPITSLISWATINISDVALTASNVYHVVVQYSGGDPPSASKNFYVYRRNYHDNIIPYDGRIDNNMNVLFYDTENWLVRDTDAIYILDYTDGTYRGQPYTIPAYNNINQAICNGEHFTVSENKLLENVGFYVSKSGSPEDSLYVILQDITTSENTTVATIAASSVSATTSWVGASVSPTVKLIAGHAYRLYLTSPLTTAVNTYTDSLQGISGTNSAGVNLLSYYGVSSYGENSSDGGATWDNITYENYDMTFYMGFREYHSSAYIESSIYDAVGIAVWDNVSWNENKPSGTSIIVKVRSGNTENSYDGTWSDWCVHEDSTENVSLPDNRYAQYRVELSTTDNLVTPEFHDITINYNTIPIAENQKTDGQVNPTHLTDLTPTLSWDYYDADNDTQTQRQIQVGTSENGNDMWDSTVSTPSASAVYAGSALSKNVTYHWRARVYDGYEWSSWLYGGTFGLYSPLTPISINGNDNFTSANGVTSGSGTAADPYIIENWVISASSANGIDIENSNVYYIVRNCVVENGGSSYYGIYLYQDNNGRIENNICENNSYGIRLSSSSYDNLTGNTCENNSYGIYLITSSYDNLTNNTCENNYYGIYLSSSAHNNLTSNTCSNNIHGILIFSSSDYDNLITNICSNNTSCGIYSISSSYDNLIGNICENNSHGIYLSSSSYDNLTNNTCSNNGGYGIYLRYSSYDNLTGNTCENNSYNFSVDGTSISNFDHNIDNLNLANGKPIYYFKDNSDLVINSSLSVGYLGLVRCDNIRVENLMLENNGQGILLASTENSYIENCVLSNNEYDIYLYSSSYDNLTNNTCSNSKYGIYLASSSKYDNLVSNVCNNNHYGIYLTSSSYDNLISNTTNSNSYGIYLSSSSSNILTGNVISNNVYDIYNTGTTNTYSANQFNNSMISKMLTFTETTRTKNVGDNITFSVSAFNPNGTAISGYTTITTSPSESSLSYDNGSSTVTGDFTPTKSGTYSLIFTVTDESFNTTRRRMLFFVGNTASATTTYYFRGTSPTHGQPLGSGIDSKTLLLTAPTSIEIWYCSLWVQNSPDEIPNYPLVNLSSINTYTWYKQSKDSGAYIGTQRYVTYNATVDNSNSIPAASDYTWINENFAENWAMDYPQSWYWASIKLDGTNPYWATFPSPEYENQPSYADFVCSYTTTPIVKSVSNPDNIVLLSATAPVDDNENATIILDGTGSTNIVLDNYHRPFIGYTTTIGSDNTATIAANGLTGTTTINSVAMNITPSSGSIDVSIDTWNTSGTYYGKWTENGSSPGITAIHTIDNLKANTYHIVKVDGTRFNVYHSNSSGQITFTYDGGYSTKTFEIEEQVPPTQPHLVSPENQLCIADNTPTFLWENGENADNHRLLVDNDSDFLTPNENRIVLDNTYTIADENSLADGVYYWKVVAINATGENESDVWWFRVDTLKPATPTLHIPENNFTVATAAPTFGWENIIDNSGVTYRLVIDDAMDFLSPIYDKSDITENQYTIENFLVNATYYWRVRAVDGAANVGDWSDNFKLVIRVLTPAPPPEPAHVASFSLTVSPSNVSGQQGSSIAVTVSVTAVEGYNKEVTFSASPPSGVSVSFSPSSGVPNFSSVMTVEVGSAPTGSYLMSVRAVGVDGMWYSVDYHLSITPAQKKIDVIEQGENGVFDFSDHILPVVAVRVVAAERISEPTVFVEVMPETPVIAPQPTLRMSYAFDITTTINQTDISEVLIMFKVSKSWVSQNNVDKSTIKLLKLDGELQEIPARATGEDVNFLYFEATTTSFALFAVAGEQYAVLPPIILLPMFMWIIYSVLASLGALGSGAAFYWRFFRPISPKISLKRLRQIRPFLLGHLKPLMIVPAIPIANLTPAPITPAPATPVGTFKPVPIATPIPVARKKVSPRAMETTEVLELLKRSPKHVEPGLRLERLRDKMLERFEPTETIDYLKRATEPIEPAVSLGSLKLAERVVLPPAFPKPLKQKVRHIRPRISIAKLNRMEWGKPAPRVPTKPVVERVEPGISLEALKKIMES